MPTTSTGKEQPDLMTIPEIATYKGLSRQRIHRLVTTDPNWPHPAVQAARTRVYRREDIDTYFENRVVQPGERVDRQLAKAVMEARDEGEDVASIAARLDLSEKQVADIEAKERETARTRKRKPRAPSE